MANDRDIAEMWRLFLLAIEGDKEAWAILVLKHFDDDVRRWVSKKYPSAFADQSEVLSLLSTSPIKRWCEDEVAEKKQITDAEIQFRLMRKLVMRVTDCRAVDLLRKNILNQDHDDKLKDAIRDQVKDPPVGPKGEVSPSEVAMDKESLQSDEKAIYLAAEELRENDQWIVHLWLNCQRPSQSDLVFRKKVAEEFDSSLEAASKRLQRTFEKLEDKIRLVQDRRRIDKRRRREQVSIPSPRLLKKLSADERWIIETFHRYNRDLSQTDQAVMIKFQCSETNAARMVQQARRDWNIILQEDDSSLV